MRFSNARWDLVPVEESLKMLINLLINALKLREKTFVRLKNVRMEHRTLGIRDLHSRQSPMQQAEHGQIRHRN